MSSRRFLSKRLIRPVLHWLIRRQVYPRGEWYERLIDRELVTHLAREPEAGVIDIGQNASPEDVAAFRRWWNQRDIK